MQLRLGKRATKTVRKRNYWKADYNAINNHLRHKLNDKDIPVSDYDHFKNILTETIEQFFPLKHVE